MPVNLPAIAAALHPIPGLRIATAMAGIRKASRRASLHRMTAFRN